MAKKKPNLTKDEASQAAKALEVLFTTEYVSKKDLYKANFIRGMFFSMGSIFGAALLLGLGLWILSLFDNIPLIGPTVENFRQTIENSQKSQ